MDDSLYCSLLRSRYNMALELATQPGHVTTDFLSLLNYKKRLKVIYSC